MRSLIFVALLSVCLAVPFTNFSPCDSSAYHVAISSVDITPYPVQQGNNANIVLTGQADNAYTIVSS